MIGGNYSWFKAELTKRVEAERLSRAESLARGAAQDFADYRYGVGFCDGMALAIEIADEITKEMDAA